MKFKVGDWVVDKNLDLPPFQVEDIDLSIPQDENYVLNNCMFWQPKVGEWCWFYDSEETDHFILARFDREDKHVNPYIAKGGGRFSYCEPFIGNLPANKNKS